MHGSEPHERLLVALAEQLKLPLLQIARGAELVTMDGSTRTHQSIAQTADVALRLIDGYLLSIAPTQTELSLEPISISALLQDTAHRLEQLAKRYDCKLEISLSGKYGPVMANRQNLEAAFTMLGYSLIEAQPSEQHPTVLLAAHKSAAGLVAGIFGSQEGLTSDMFRRARALYGSARQPLTSTTTASSAGIFIADSLMQSMAAPLHLARHHRFTGLAATLLPSRQLHFVGVA